jgi:L-lactate dehydrogenase
MTAITTRIAMRHGIPKQRVIGSGTILDTARFRSLLSKHLGVSSHSIHAHVIGEHGDSEVLHWSGASISNISLKEFSCQIGAPVTEDVRNRITDAVRNAAYRIIAGKGATNYGIGAGLARLADIIIRDESAVLTCCTLLERVEGVTDVCLSLPHIVSAKGAEKILYPTLNAQEQAALHESATILKSYMDKLSSCDLRLAAE